MEEILELPIKEHAMALVAGDISVVLCTYTEARWPHLVAAVTSLHNQTASPLEIIVVVDHNPRLLQRAQEELAGISAIENRQARGLAGARNSGIEAARGAVIAFLDDDALPAADWLEHLAASYTSPSILGVGGRIEPSWSPARPSWFPAEFDWVVGCTYTGMPSERTVVRNMIGANMSVRRWVLQATGGFDTTFGWQQAASGSSPARPRFQLGEDETELCLRITRLFEQSELLYVPSAVVYHHVPPQRMRWSYFCWRCYAEGLGKATLSGLYSTRTSLATELHYVTTTLPRGLLRSFSAPPYGDPPAFARAFAILLGLLTTIFGYLVGLWAHPGR